MKKILNYVLISIPVILLFLGVLGLCYLIYKGTQITKDDCLKFRENSFNYPQAYQYNQTSARACWEEYQIKILN